MVQNGGEICHDISTSALGHGMSSVLVYWVMGCNLG